MDEFEKRLKQDAAGIQAKISPELEDRIRASLHAAGREVPQPTRHTAVSKLWWASSLTGLAAAAAVIVLVNMSSVPGDAPVPAPLASRKVPDYRLYIEEFQGHMPLRADAVEFTDGLEEELARLQADLERARQSVSRDIDFTF
jgi:hypothetical protein